MTTRCRITCGMGEFLVWVAVEVMPALRPESESRDEKLMEIVVCALHRFASLCIALHRFVAFSHLFSSFSAFPAEICSEPHECCSRLI